MSNAYSVIRIFQHGTVFIFASTVICIEWRQYAPLWCPCVTVSDTTIRNSTIEFDIILRSQSQVTVNPSNKITVYIHIKQFTCHNMRLDGIESISMHL